MKKGLTVCTMILVGGMGAALAIGFGSATAAPEVSAATIGAAATGNLPTRLTSFLGRDRELDELSRLLPDSRLITLTGPGGTGKTSLATEFARRHAEAFPHGAWFVRLDAITDPSLVAPAVGGVLRLLELLCEHVGQIVFCRDSVSKGPISGDNHVQVAC